MIAAAPPPPPPLAVVAPAPREVSFGRIAGRVQPGRWTVEVHVGKRRLAVRRVRGGSFDFQIALPQGEVTVRVTVRSGRKRASASVGPVFGLPRSARPGAVRAVEDTRLASSVRGLVRAFPATAGVYVEDLVSGHGAAWNARARFPAGSTLKLAIAVELLRVLDGKPEPGSSLERLLRQMLIESDNAAANAIEGYFGGGSRVNELLRGLGLADSEMYGGYLREPQARRPVPVRTEAQPAFGRGKYTTAWDLARLLTYVHLAADGRGPLARRYRGQLTPADARYLLWLLAHVPDRGKLGRFLPAAPVALLHKAGWISTARHDAGLVYWPSGVYVAVVMTWSPSGAGTASDVLAGRVAQVALARLRQLG